MNNKEMKLLLVDNVYLYKTPDGKYYTPSIYNKDFFQRYLNVFSSVRLVAKTQHVPSINTKDYIHIDFPNVEVHELTWYRGFNDFLRKLIPLSIQAVKSRKGCSCTIYRVAQLESFLVYFFSARKRPFALEVVNDPESWSSTNVVLKSITTRVLRHMCRTADGVSYVTEQYLQKNIHFQLEEIHLLHITLLLNSSLHIWGKKRKEKNSKYLD